MSIITVQLGQCGNQIGGQMFESLMEDNCTKVSQTQVSPKVNEEYVQESVSRFFTEPSKKDGLFQARAVMVDMEPKVIAQTCQNAKKSGRWMYPPKQQFCQQRGSGNNWAHGFCVHGPKNEEEVMKLVQTEAEKCDYLGGFLSLLSLAGGTGSGVGAYITQCLRDEFPHAFLLNQVVLPYSMGEVIVQNYNAVMTLSHLYRSVDAIVAMENDHLHKICSRLLNIKKIAFSDINKVITHKLASILQPALLHKSSSLSIQNNIADMMEHLVPHPDYKLLTVKNIPQMSTAAKEFSSYKWHGLLKHLHQMLIADAAMEEGIDWNVKLGGDGVTGRYNRSLANLLLLRGKEVSSIDTTTFSDSMMYASWVPQQDRFLAGIQPRLFTQYEKCASLVSNSGSPIHSMNNIVDKAWGMFSSRAYVHQYHRHGLSDEDFLDSFVTLEQVISSYRNL